MAAPQGMPELKVGLMAPGTCCQEGMDQRPLTPPPPACVPSFQATSELYALPEARLNDVPPTPVTYGCDAGSSTLGMVGVVWPQSLLPESPEAAKML